MASANSALHDFDDWWNFADPAGTELKFREALARVQAHASETYIAELLTQIARAEGLQMKFEEATSTLDQANARITSSMRTAKVRSLLEGGRVLNSSGKPDKASPVFEEALQLARSSGLDFYAVDAAHMLGIVTKGDESLRWNEEAMRLAEGASEQRAKRWLGTLYNNTGWTYFELKRYPDALRMFEKDIEFRGEAENREALGIARWSRAKVLRYLGRIEEALQVQMGLLQWPELKGGENEGYTREEIAECLLLMGRPEEATPHFAQAWELLNKDPWLSRNEPARLERLKQLGGK
jgi:tetratricopeptide (TPR) repeat protein